jgi:hypothetical protein
MIAKIKDIRIKSRPSSCSDSIHDAKMIPDSSRPSPWISCIHIVQNTFDVGKHLRSKEDLLGTLTWNCDDRGDVLSGQT